MAKEQKQTKPDKKKEKHKLGKLKKRILRNEVDPRCGEQLPQNDEQCMDQAYCNDSKARRKIGDSAEFKEANIGRKIKTKKVKKAGKNKKKDLHVPPDECKLEENHKEIDPTRVDEISSMDEDCSRGMKKKVKKVGKSKKKDLHVALDECKLEENHREIDPAKVDEISSVDEDCSRGMKKKVKKAGKSKKKELHVPPDECKLEENHKKIDPAKVDEISSVDEDCSRGMKKWLIRYKESRPGLKVLQQRIDEFITAYEVQKEQERKEREARAAEGGWTVVVHHKGRKKTTDSETGITVGSVAQAVVMDKMAKKKKEVALDFYRFQRRETQRNEVMMLQSKFERDKKRIQQLRAARKFRPY